MARIRSIHPGLTSDEAYMSMSMTTKAAWTPLWMQCDDHGIFEWKPIVLKALIFPADNVDFTAVLDELLGIDCVRKIDIGGKPHGIVRNFAKYQRPKNPSYRYFKPEELPAELGSYIAIKGAAAPALPQPSPSAPENLPQMKEEVGRKEEGRKKEPSSASRPRNDDFEKLKQVYPRRGGNYGWKKAEAKFNALVKTGVDPKIIIAAAGKLCETLRAKIGTEYIPMPASWLNSEDFTEVAAMAFAAPAAPQRLAIEDAVRLYAQNGIWSRHAPVSDISQAPPDLLARFGLMPDGRKMEGTCAN